jgi:hypothetical protein
MPSYQFPPPTFPSSDAFPKADDGYPTDTSPQTCVEETRSTGVIQTHERIEERDLKIIYQGQCPPQEDPIIGQHHLLLSSVRTQTIEVKHTIQWRSSPPRTTNLFKSSPPLRKQIWNSQRISRRRARVTIFIVNVFRSRQKRFVPRSSIVCGNRADG